MTLRWDGPFGAVRPLEAPSELTAEPRITASTSCPSRIASDSGASSSTPAPSPQPVPSAVSANALHRPSPARPPCRLNSLNRPSPASTDTPPASAIPHSPARSDWQARWIATSEDEHAVSTVIAGPLSPNR